MEPSLLVYTLTRFLHVGTAIVLVGGTFFILLVLRPAVIKALSDEEHARLRSSLVARWRPFVHGGIALLLLTGLINYYRVIAEGSHKGDGLYHALLGTKIILALVIFFVASALVGRSSALEAMRRNAPRWLMFNLALATLIVAVSGFLKVRGVPGRQAPEARRASQMSTMTSAIQPSPARSTDRPW